jgi:hypothetical protein
VTVEIRDVAPGFWLWRQPHPDWREGLDWGPDVSSFCVESRGEVILLDPLAPPPSEREAWERIDAAQPTVAVVLKPDHVRDVDLFVRWYGVRAHGPELFWGGDAPKTELEPVYPGFELPGGPLRLYERPQRDAGLAPPAARARLRGRIDGAARRAPRLGDALARGAGAPGAPEVPRAAVRARPGLARRAGAHPRRFRGCAPARAVQRLKPSRATPARAGGYSLAIRRKRQKRDS